MAGASRRVLVIAFIDSASQYGSWYAAHITCYIQQFSPDVLTALAIALYMSFQWKG